MKPLILYVTGFRQHAGKTVTSLGILSLLRKRFEPEELGYIKPVGQEFVQLEDGKLVDKDARIIEKFSRIPDLDMGSVSPVLVGAGFTKEFLESKDQKAETKKLKQLISDAIKVLKRKKIIVAEGTGHPGVGGILGISNAEVGNLIDADLLFLSGGGIGKALDMLEVDLSYFMYKKNRVRGIIFNKCLPDKLESMKDFITEDLLNKRYPEFPQPLRIFGYLPSIEFLYKPSMNVIKDIFRDAHIIGNPNQHAWKTPCNSIRIISLSAEYLHPEHYLKPGDIVLLGSASKNRRARILSYNKTLKKCSDLSLGGIILTCGATTSLDPEVERHIADSGIPALYVQEDTAATEQKISASFESTKLQTYDAEKIRMIEELFDTYFDTQKFFDTFDL